MESPGFSPASPETQPTFKKESHPFLTKEKIIAGLGSVAFATTTFGAAQAFGENVNGFFDEHKLLEQASFLSGEDQEKIKNLQAVIAPRAGSKAVLELMRISKGVEDAPSEPAIKPAISGFDSTGLITDADIAKATSTLFFPQGWVDGKISSISYAPKEVFANGDLPTMAENIPNDKKSSIVFYKISTAPAVSGDEYKRYASLSLALSTLRHEICHSNDWLSTSKYSVIDRAELLASIALRTESADAYAGHQVETKGKVMPYHASFGNSEIYQRHTSYREYFADVCSAYFLNPVHFKEAHPKDFELVDSWVKKTDPDFKGRRLSESPYSDITGKINLTWKNIFG
jgi:hypothetical protein